MARWDFDRQLCDEPTRRVAVLTLTVPEGEPAAVIGDIYRFWAKVRRRWLGVRYFCWLEIQARGAAHYHAVWLNPPNRKEINLQAWVNDAWGRGRTQVHFSGDPNRIQNEVDYAVAHSKKRGRKAYQQNYDAVPSQLRTFMSQRLEIPPARIDECLSRALWRYHRGGWRPSRIRAGISYLGEPYLELIGDREHVLPAGGRCRALEFRRALRSPPRRSLTRTIDRPPSSRSPSA